MKTHYEEIYAALRPLATSDFVIRTGQSSQRHRSFFGIPNGDQLRWLVPADPKLGLAVLRSWFPHSIVSRSKWHMILCAYQLGQISRLPGVCHFDIQAEFSCTIDADQRDAYTPVVYFGTPTPFRKAVTSLVSQDGNVAAVAKTPLAPRANQAIQREACALEEMSAVAPRLAPRLLRQVSDGTLTIQEYIGGKSGERMMRPEYMHWLFDLRADGRDVVVGEVLDAIRQEVGGDSRFPYFELMDGVISGLPAQQLYPAFRVHGDFAPWNLRVHRSGEIAGVVDWEEFSSLGLPLVDYFHYHFIQAYLFNDHVDVGVLRKRSAEYRRHFGLADRDVATLALMYLLASIVHFWHQGDLAHCEWLAGVLANFRFNGY